jgi:hypothetical protein
MKKTLYVKNSKGLLEKVEADFTERELLEITASSAKSTASNVRLIVVILIIMLLVPIFYYLFKF